MGECLIMKAGSAADTDELTATAADVLKGKTALINGTDEPVEGTLEVQSILSFSAAAYSSTQVTLTWKNPAKGPYSGVLVRYKTGSAPTSVTDGTEIYLGTGSNIAAGGSSAQIVGGLAPSMTYYFSAWGFAMINGVRRFSETVLIDNSATLPRGIKTITSSGAFVVPAGVTVVDLFGVGGGRGGYAGKGRAGGDGGSGGYTATKLNLPVLSGETITVTVGAGGSSNMRGGATSFVKKGITVLSADGGQYGAGGSGGGGYGHASKTGSYPGGNGGSNGSDGGGGLGPGLKGQGRSTRAFGETSGTLYAGGGGGGGGWLSSAYNSNGGSGGSGGGGYGGQGGGGYGMAASNGTGGGGGGGNGTGASYDNEIPGGAGGSGVALIRWGY